MVSLAAVQGLKLHNLVHDRLLSLAAHRRHGLCIDAKTMCALCRKGFTLEVVLPKGSNIAEAKIVHFRAESNKLFCKDRASEVHCACC